MKKTTPTIGGAKVTDLAEKMAIPYTTIHTWYRAGKIPRWRRDAVNAAIAAIKQAESAGDNAANEIRNQAPLKAYTERHTAQKGRSA